MTDSERETLSALAHMCAQYLGDDTGNYLDHMWMGAGERAFAVLLRHGLIEPTRDRSTKWTEAGHNLLNST